MPDTGVKPTLRLAVDIGGTFTDVAAFDETTGRLMLGKALSTPQRLVEGINAGVDKAGVAYADAGLFLHGSTIAINTILERTGARTALVITEGFRDIYEIGRVNRPDSYNLYFRKHVPLIERALRFEVPERMYAEGAVRTPLDEAALHALAARLKAIGTEAVAILFLHCYANPAHELRAREILQAALPDAFISASHELSQEYREFERCSTVAANAYIGPRVQRYLEGIDEHLKETGFAGSFLVVQSTGGLFGADVAKRQCVRMLESGPAAGVIGTQALCHAAGLGDAIAFDMGGTTAKAGVIHGGAPLTTGHAMLGGYEQGLPVQIAMMDIFEVGTGGGSIAWLAEDGSLRVGPQSAGAEPGPACYGRGGTQPTVTDADLVLGYIDADSFLGGRLRLDRDKARASLEPIATQLGLGLIETASGAVRVVEHQMADLIRKVTVQKGYDPRDCVVFAYGGAGPVHAGVYARELGAQGVVVPLGGLCSLWSALGAASADLLHIYEAVDILSSPFDPARVNAHFAGLEARGVAQLRADGVDPASARLARSADLRYKGQINEVEVPLTSGRLDEAALAQLIADFHRRYETVYGRGAGFQEARVEIVTYRVRASAISAKPRIVAAPEADRTPAAAARAGTRPVYWSELGDFQPTPVYWSDKLAPGNVVPGPAIIQAADTTIVVHPFESARLDPYGNVLVDLGANRG